MSIKVMTHVWEHSKQSGTKLVTMLSVADHCDDNGGCWPGLRRLALKARIVQYTSMSAIVNNLAAIGEITIVRRPGRSNYYFVTDYCRQNSVDLDAVLAEYGMKRPYEIVGGWQMKDAEDDEPDPSEDDEPDPSEDDEPDPSEDDEPDPSEDDEPESSVESSAVESSVEPSGESSSSKSADDDDDEFDLTDKEKIILCEAFGSISARAIGCLRKNRALTIGWAEYALATRICYDPGDELYVDTPPPYIFKCVSNGDPVKTLPVETAKHKAKREFDALSDAEKAEKSAGDEAAEKESERRLLEAKQDESERVAARKDKAAAQVEAERLEADRLQADADRDAKLWFEHVEIERQEWAKRIDKKLEENGDDRLAVITASQQLLKRIRPNDAAKCGQARRKWHKFIFDWQRRKFQDQLLLVDCFDEEIVRGDGSVLSVKVPVAIYGCMPDGLKQVMVSKPEPFIRIMSALQYHEMYIQKGTKNVG